VTQVDHSWPVYGRPMGFTLAPVVCEVCGRPCPYVNEPSTLPPEHRTEALRAGWRYDEQDRWMCRQCLAPTSNR
jgi:hypothetical protein